MRTQFPHIPILLFTPVPQAYLSLCVQNNFCVTVANQQQAEEAAAIRGLNVVIRANGGSDIFGGPTTRDGFESIWNTLSGGVCTLTGIYLHSYNAEDGADTQSEYETFERITEGVDLSGLKLVSISNSLSLPRYDKKTYCNGCRLGNIIYRIESEDPELEHTFRLESEVLCTFTLKKGQSVAYSHAYTAEEDEEIIASVPIGFGDGFSKTNIGRDVYINGRRFPIVTVTMDIINIRVDETVKAGDKVLLIQDNHHLDEISAHIHGATEEPITNLNNRVFREYLD